MIRECRGYLKCVLSHTCLELRFLIKHFQFFFVGNLPATNIVERPCVRVKFFFIAVLLCVDHKETLKKRMVL